MRTAFLFCFSVGAPEGRFEKPLQEFKKKFKVFLKRRRGGLAGAGDAFRGVVERPTVKSGEESWPREAGEECEHFVCGG